MSRDIHFIKIVVASILGVIFFCFWNFLVVSAQFVEEPRSYIDDRFATSTLTIAEQEKYILEEEKMDELISAVNRNSDLLIRIYKKL